MIFERVQAFSPFIWYTVYVVICPSKFISVASRATTQLTNWPLAPYIPACFWKSKSNVSSHTPPDPRHKCHSFWPTDWLGPVDVYRTYPSYIWYPVHYDPPGSWRDDVHRSHDNISRTVPYSSCSQIYCDSIRDLIRDDNNWDITNSAEKWKWTNVR